MLFNLFKKKQQHPLINYSSIKVDIHSHLLPGIDDGAQSLEESVILVRRLVEAGYKKIITTPHIMADFYRNTPEIIRNSLSILRDELKRQNIDIQIEAAAEYYLDETFEKKLDAGDVLTVGKNHILFELSYIDYPPNINAAIFKMIAMGYKPILAHPERYPYFAGSLDNYIRVRESGCALQLNIISLTGYYGKAIQQIAEKLVDNNLVDFIGSDMHHVRHADALYKGMTTPYVHRLLTDYPLQNEKLL